MKNLSPSRLILSAAFAAVTLAIAVSPATAAATTAEPSKLVRYGDLNLSSREGVAVLYRRLQSAAAEVCGPATAAGSRKVSRGYTDCVSTAVHQAVLRIHRAEVTAYHMSIIAPRLFTAAS